MGKIITPGGLDLGLGAVAPKGPSRREALTWSAVAGGGVVAAVTHPLAARAAKLLEPSTAFEQQMQRAAERKRIGFVDAGVDAFASDRRKELTREYARFHYLIDDWRLEDPQAIILHATGGPTYESVRNTFEGDTLRGRPELEGTANAVNVSAHFVIDRDGTIHQHAPLDFMCRGAIGYNWTALHIEVVSDRDDRDPYKKRSVDDPSMPYTEEQVRSAAWLTEQLMGRFPTVRYVFPHRDYRKDPYRELIRAEGDSNYHPGNPHFGKEDPYGDDFARVWEKLRECPKCLEHLERGEI